MLTLLYGSVAEDLTKKGAEFFSEKKYSDAIRSWKVVIQDHRKELSKKEQLDLFLNLSMAYESIGMTKSALKCLDYATKLDPQNSHVKNEIVRLRQVESVKASFRENQSGGSGMHAGGSGMEPIGSGVTGAKTWVESKFVYGQSVKSTLEPYLLRLSEAIKLEDNQAGAGQKIFHELRPVFDKAVREDREPGAAYHGLGTCLFYLNEDDYNARAYLKKSNSFEPEYIEAHAPMLKILNEKNPYKSTDGTTGASMKRK
jgi:tetratricopeptide (TPR) repeat protein